MAGSSTHTIKNVCEFYGSSSRGDETYMKVATLLGNVLADRSLHLVYGGGNMGLMGAVATAVASKGSQVLGVIPTTFVPLGVKREVIGEEVQVTGMHERIKMMMDESDAFIAQIGRASCRERVFRAV